MAKSVTGIRLAVAALLLAPLLAYAAGLGRLTVNSGLGQPLNAEIEIVSLQPGEEDSLTARLASSEAFRQAGIEMTAVLVDIQFSIDRRGRPVIRIRSNQPINEPFLDMLVELQWATGRLVREYTFLLDPPEYRQPKPAAAAPQPSARPAPEPSVVKPAPRVESRPLVSEPARAAGAAAGSYEVKKGDTLGAIARQNLPQGVTLNQMLIALFRANQEAFIQGNINLVRAGRILSIPDRDAAVALANEDANRLVQSHMSDFAEYKRKLGVAVAAAPAKPAPREREVTGRISPKPEAPAPAESKDQLKLSKAEPAKPGSAAAKAARDDDRAAREGALKEAQSRVGTLEKNVSDLQKLVEMKNQQLAEVEKKAAADKAAAAAAAAKAAKAAPAPAAKAPEPVKPEPPKAAPKPEPAKPEPPKAEPAKPEPAKAEPPKAEPPKAEPAKAEPAKAEAPKPAAKDAAKEPSKDKAKATPTKAAAPEKGIVEEFLDDPIFLGGLGGVLLLLVGYGAWAWRKKKKAQSSGFQDSVLGAASGVGGSSVFDAAPAAAPVAAAAAAPQASVASTASAPAPAPESDEVDPIAEADVYMAYGRDAQAEEILKESLAKDPDRLAVHAKLLEIYANRKDGKSFEQSALKVKSLTQGAGPEWDKAMALGHSIDPGNGLYGSGGAAAAEAPAAHAAPTVDFDIGGGEPAAAASAPATAEAGGGGLDFDLGATSPKVEATTDFAPGGTLITDAKATQPAMPSGLDFDLGGAAPAVEDDSEKTMLLPPRKPAAAAEKKVDPDQTVSMDFDLNLDIGGAKPEAAAKPEEAPLDLGALNLDLGAPSEAPGQTDPKWQEVATKLDLAKAYAEMGDKDGAKELLNEVMKEGDAAQKGQAEQMLAGLG